MVDLSIWLSNKVTSHYTKKPLTAFAEQAPTQTFGRALNTHFTLTRFFVHLKTNITCPIILVSIVKQEPSGVLFFKNYLTQFGRGYYPPLFKSSPPVLPIPLFFQSCVIPPDKQYLFFKNFAFFSSVDAVENVTIKEILISV